MTLKYKKTFFSFAFFLSFFQLLAQDFIFPKYQIKGEVVKIYETTIQVFLRTDTWAFEKREFQFGEIIELDEIRQYQAIYQYYDVNQLLSNFQFSTLLDGRLAMGKFYVDDELSSSVDFAYNSSGQISSAVFTYEKAKKASKCYEYEYHDGELIQTKMTILFRDTFEVNYRIVNGNISETIKKNNSGQIALKSKYEYNKEGYPSKIEFFEKDGKLKNRKTYIYQYDEKANWTKRLETDSKRDVRTLTQRVLVYKDNLKTKKISKKELIGSWKGWSEEIFIDFKENTAEVAIKKERLVHAYQYDSYFGALLLKTKDFERPKSYLTEFDGKILTLNQQNNENVFFLKKINLNNFDSPKEKDFFYYFQRKPKAKVFRSNNKFGLKSKTGKVLKVIRNFVVIAGAGAHV